MPNWTRRDVLKSALAASAGAVLPSGSLPAERSDETSGVMLAREQSSETSASPRERLLLDFGWRFQLGHANEAGKDLGYGARRRESTFAKSGSFLPVTGTRFDDSSWKSVDLPHDWAVELPFQEAPILPNQGAKPLGREYPETSIGWYRRVFELPASYSGKRITLEFDGAFRHAMVMLNGHYLGENFSGYVPFRFDVTDFANLGEKNVLVVRVD